MLLEKHSLQSSPWVGAKPLAAHGLVYTYQHVILTLDVAKWT